MTSERGNGSTPLRNLALVQERLECSKYLDYARGLAGAGKASLATMHMYSQSKGGLAVDEGREGGEIYDCFLRCRSRFEGHLTYDVG